MALLNIITLSSCETDLFWGYSEETRATYPPPCSMLSFNKALTRRFVEQPYVGSLLATGYGRYRFKEAPRVVLLRKFNERDGELFKDKLGLTGEVFFNDISEAFCESNIEADGFLKEGSFGYIVLREPERFLSRVGGGSWRYTPKQLKQYQHMIALIRKRTRLHGE